MRPQPLLAGIELEVASDAELPAVEVDLRRLDQVFVNLVENAAHALRGVARAADRARARRCAHDSARPARRAGDPSAARFVGQRAPDAVALRVIDNGPGIDAEHLPHVFDPFFTTKEPGEGTGLGTVERAPAGRADGRKARSHESVRANLLQPAAAGGRYEARPWPSGGALIIDDEAGVRTSLGLILEDEGYEVATAADGDQGLRAAQAERFDVVLCDVRMPRRGGLDDPARS